MNDLIISAAGLAAAALVLYRVAVAAAVTLKEGGDLL